MRDAQSKPVMTLTVGKLAARCGIRADTVRFYEAEGLLKPKTRTASGYRLYDESAIKRIEFIQHAQQCGFSLADIAQLLELKTVDKGCCDDVRRVAIEKQLALKQRIRTLTGMAEILDRLIVACSDSSRPLDECPILAAMDRAPDTSLNK